MSKAGSMLRFGAAKTRSKKAKANAAMARTGAGMAVRDSAKAAAHAAAGLAQTVRDEAEELTGRAGELTERAAEATRLAGEQAMLRVGEWVMTPPVAEKLGLKAKARRVGLFGMAAGLGVGMVAGVLLARRKAVAPGSGASYGDQVPDGSWGDLETLAPPVGRGQVDLEGTAESQVPGTPNSTTVTA